MKKFKIAGLLALAFFLASCAAETTVASKSEAELCAEKGGTLEKRGMLQSEMCVIPYADAGNQCTDSSQCEGRCLASLDAAQSPDSEQQTGQCEADNSPFGCYVELLDGKAETGICVD